MKIQKYFPKYLTNDQKVVRPEKFCECHRLVLAFAACPCGRAA